VSWTAITAVAFNGARRAMAGLQVRSIASGSRSCRANGMTRGAPMSNRDSPRRMSDRTKARRDCQGSTQ
jgi:hypothetical protein